MEEEWLDARVPREQLAWFYPGRYVFLALISELLSHDFQGSSGDNIVAHFAVYYHNEAARLGVDLNDLYSALLADGDLNPPEWNTEGRQVNVYK
jgi:hypothetical protein